MSDDLILPRSELASVLDWAVDRVGREIGSLEDEEERIERKAGIFRQQQQISRESERLWEEAESRKTAEQKRADALNRAKAVIVQTGITFLRHWFVEVRAIVCSDDMLSVAAAGSGLTASSIAAGLAATLSSSLAITNPMAVGLAAVIVTIIGTAGLKTFCAMSRDEAATIAARARDTILKD